MIWAASKGDLSTIVQLEAQGADIARAYVLAQQRLAGRPAIL
jgi:hypothetical protein